jgi:toxin ParE1/3/4
MSGRVERLGPARRDLVDVFHHYARKGEIGTARRFLKDAEATFERLASMPGLGLRYEPDDPAFADLRVAPLGRFKNHLVFYRPIPGGIEVLRVLHGARDIRGLLAEDLGLPADGDEDADSPAEG